MVSGCVVLRKMQAEIQFIVGTSDKDWGGGGPRRKLSDGRLSAGKARNLGFHSHFLGSELPGCPAVADPWPHQQRWTTLTRERGGRGKRSRFLHYSLASNQPT